MRKLVCLFSLSLFLLTSCQEEKKSLFPSEDKVLDYLLVIGDDQDLNCKLRLEGVLEGLKEISNKHGIKLNEVDRVNCIYQDGSTYSDLALKEYIEENREKLKNLNLVISSTNYLAIGASTLLGSENLYSLGFSTDWPDISGSLVPDNTDGNVVYLTSFQLFSIFNLVNNIFAGSSNLINDKCDFLNFDLSNFDRHIIKSDYYPVLKEENDYFENYDFSKLEHTRNKETKKISLYLGSLTTEEGSRYLRELHYNNFGEIFNIDFGKYAYYPSGEYVDFDEFDAFVYKLDNWEDYDDIIEQANGKPLVFYSNEPSFDFFDDKDLSSYDNVYFFGKDTLKQKEASKELIIKWFVSLL